MLIKATFSSVNRENSLRLAMRDSFRCLLITTCTNYIFVKTPQCKEEKVYFGSQFVEISVYGPMSPGEGSMVEGNHRGELAHDFPGPMKSRERENKGGTGKRQTMWGHPLRDPVLSGTS